MSQSLQIVNANPCFRKNFAHYETRSLEMPWGTHFIGKAKSPEGRQEWVRNIIFPHSTFESNKPIDRAYRLINPDSLIL